MKWINETQVWEKNICLSHNNVQVTIHTFNLIDRNGNIGMGGIDSQWESQISLSLNTFFCLKTFEKSQIGLKQDFELFWDSQWGKAR